VDGGTTATVVALLQGHLLVVANVSAEACSGLGLCSGMKGPARFAFVNNPQVGDSDALLGGRLPDGSIGFEQLCADHAPTNVDEYIRMAQLATQRPDGWEPAVCAYDTDVGSLLEIFRISEQVKTKCE
jgi:serine/threonine protein phosphatase PrpC